MNRGLRIGLLVDGFISWGGGIDFLAIVTDCLRVAQKDAPLTFVTVTRRSPRPPRRRDWLYEACVRHCLGGIHTPLRRHALVNLIGDANYRNVATLHSTLGGQIPIRTFRDDDSLDAIAASERLDCFFPVLSPLKPSVRTPWVGYIADFQHRRMPDLFSPDEREARDRHFQLMAKAASHVITNSRDSYEDCRRYLGTSDSEFVAIPFAAAAQAEWFDDEPTNLKSYRLPTRYFLICNQFWIHKNHRVAFEALSQLIVEPGYEDVGLVCTGSTADYRDPTYFPSLVKFLENNQLTNRVAVLGFIPKRDQIEIMKRSVAVIQPTLFEGGPGGGAVYDAISLDVPSLVSDIPVNRDLEGHDYPIRFFPPTSADALAALMRDCLQRPSRRVPDTARLLAEGERRRRVAGDTLLRTIHAAIEGSMKAPFFPPLPG